MCVNRKSKVHLEDLKKREAPNGGVTGALEPIILKAWSPGAQAIPMAIFSNFKK